ncbi:hypothetical protein EYF80_058052 [Liparis tanakae]|uniref:Uncharacterized protein n=1 Tax=Liparis tanakae TaxID=230148 RepID=A0A4Z2EU43_9TELE|nr:hypothetical protein EYF80_058052 [Liparis tanakae]
MVNQWVASESSLEASEDLRLTRGQHGNEPAGFKRDHKNLKIHSEEQAACSSPSGRGDGEQRTGPTRHRLEVREHVNTCGPDHLDGATSRTVKLLCNDILRLRAVDNGDASLL